MIHRNILASMGIATMIAVGGAQAQGPRQRPQADGATPAGAPAAGQDQPRPFWQDPSARLRMLRQRVSERVPMAQTGGPGRGGARGGRFGGGPGGPGGGSGMLGLLLESPALQEEIGLSEEQKQGLREYSQSMRERQRELFRNLRPAQGGRGGRGQQGPQPFQFDPAQMEQMQQAMAALQSESQTVISKILTPQQLERLEQIRLRIIGPTAVAEEKVARSLMLAPEQFQQVQNIMAEYDLQAVNLMRQNFEAMRGQGGPGGPGAFGGPGGAQNPGNIRGGVAGPGANRGAVGGAPGGAAAAGGGGQDAGDRRAFFNSPQFREMQERMARMAEEEDQLLKRAEAAIAKALTTRQKQQFNRMLGEPFDLTKLVQGPPQGGGRRGQGRDGERPGETPQPAGPATATSAPQPAAAVAGGDAGASAAAPSSGGRTRIPPRVRGFTNDNGR